MGKKSRDKVPLDLSLGITVKNDLTTNVKTFTTVKYT
jgi:hypothetical protein